MGKKLDYTISRVNERSPLAILTGKKVQAFVDCGSLYINLYGTIYRTPLAAESDLPQKVIIKEMEDAWHKLGFDKKQ